MDRRRFLRIFAGSLAPTLATGAPGAWAQPRPVGKVMPADTPTVRPVLDTAPGVTTNDIRVGMSAAFRGTAAGLGAEFYRGAQAYYNDVNGKGGVYGRPISVIALDDGYEPIPCVKNTIHLLEKEPVFLLSNYVGTPTLTRALPVITEVPRVARLDGAAIEQ